MGNLKNAIIAGAFACGIGVAGTAGSLVTSGQTLFGFSSNDGMKVEAKAWFTPNVKTESYHGSGLQKGKHVQQSWVKITEGDYDSGRVYSAKAANTSASGLYEAYHSKTNNPFSTAYTSYDWIYFK